MLGVIQSCDIFQTRDPEQPIQGTSSITPPDLPEIVLENLRNAISQDNTDNYIKSFGDTTFHFVPTTEVAAQYTGIFHDWSIDDERNYFRNLGAPQNGTPYLTFENQQKTQISSDSVLYIMDYTLYFPHRRQGIPQLAFGKMQLEMRPDAHRLWYIATWHDYTTTTDSTWSYLKARFSGS